MKKYISWILGLCLFGIFYYYSCQFFPGLMGYHEFHYTPDAYQKEVKLIQEKKSDFLLSFNSDKNINRARHFFQDELDERLFPYWLGTNYDFYGQTYIPGKGKIACGYFVTTLLEDMGVDLDRNALAKMASENMIKHLVSEKHIKRYSNQSLKRVLADITFEGKAVYIVGLDTHTGFLLNDGDEIYFVHASGRNPWQVVREIAENSIVLNESAYRVIGHLTADDEFLVKKWLNNVINTD